MLFAKCRVDLGKNTACASCHQQKNAFVDLIASKGHADRLTSQPISLVNLRHHYQRGRFFWDERASSLEDQVLKPIQSPLEMGNDLTKLIDTIAKDETYPKLYEKAFGSTEVTPERTARALAQFVRSLVSYQSKYDEGLAKAKIVRTGARI